jgi:glycosyltransferase involved in cell wall biosynthesis
MKILVVAPRVPWPPLDGGRVAIGAIALGLRDAGADVELVALNPRKHRSDARELPDRRGPLAISTLPHDSSASALAVALGLLSRHRSVVAARFESRELERFVRERVSRGDVDVVQIEGPMLAGCIEAARSGGNRPLVALRSQNVEHAIWQRLADGATLSLTRVAMRRVAMQLREHERAANEASDALIAISPGDLAAFRELGFTKPATVIPIGIDSGACAPAPHDSRGVFFIGSLDYRPNQEGLLWLAEEVLPLVRALAPSITVSAAGSNAPPELGRRVEASGIRVAGQVTDARAFMSASGVMAVPLMSGSGVRVKIAEAMAFGVPVVTTTLGAEGLGVESGREVIIADGAEAFAEALVRVEGDESLRRRLAAASREFVARELDRELLGRRLLEFYRGLRG